MNIEYKSITYKDMSTVDKYAMSNNDIILYQSKRRQFILGSNPNIDKEKTFIYLAIVKGEVIGRIYYLKSYLNIAGIDYPALSASALMVNYKFRHYAVGADIVLHTALTDEYDYQIFAGISSDALPLYKKLKYNIFILPKYRLFRNSEAYLRNKGLKGMPLKLISKGANIIMSLRYMLHKSNKAKYNVIQFQQVPEWVNDIALYDGHKYMERHDQRWLQWNLMGSFAEDEKNCQQFYGIMNGETPMGFFMTKQRRTIKSVNMIDGYIVEWGSADENLLSEAEIYKLAIPTFDHEVSDIFYGSTNQDTINTMSKLGFRYVCDEYILFKQKKIIDKDLTDSNLWRLRLGYADTIFS